MSGRKYFQCPYCNKKLERPKLIEHVEKKHSDMIPEGFTPTRIVFNSINYNNLDYDGKCVICGGPSDWDENKARYNRLCNSPECKKKFNSNSVENLYRTKGIYHMTDTVENLEYMLSKRKVSGKYKFRDGSEKTYTASYERRAAEFFDQVIEARSEDVQMPGPSMEYIHNGEKHIYISDIYYAPYNLVIEVKDGGDRPNGKNMPEYRARQLSKEKHIIENTDYNYLRLVDNDFSQLLEVLADLKMQLVDKSYDRVIHINENMFAASQGMIPPATNNSLYIINYRKRNTFINDDDTDIAVSDSPKFDSVFYRNEEGILSRGNYELFEECEYNVYVVKDRKNLFESKIKDRIDTFIDRGFLYESVFNKKMYSHDQIMFEPLAEETIDFYDAVKEYNVMLKESISVTYKTLLPMMENNVFQDIYTGDQYVKLESVRDLIAKKDNLTQNYILKVIEAGGKPNE